MAAGPRYSARREGQDMTISMQRADRGWLNEAVRRIEADYNRSADTHLIRVELPRHPGITLYLKDESSRLGLPSFKILGASWGTHRAICERDLAIIAHPAQRMLHPLRVVAFRIVVMGLRTATLATRLRAHHRRRPVSHEVLQLQRLDEIRIPDQATVADREIREP